MFRVSMMSRKAFSVNITNLKDEFLYDDDLAIIWNLASQGTMVLICDDLEAAKQLFDVDTIEIAD